MIINRQTWLQAVTHNWTDGIYVVGVKMGTFFISLQYFVLKLQCVHHAHAMQNCKCYYTKQQTKDGSYILHILDATYNVFNNKF